MNLQKLKEQVEFYFSDSNYAKDKFMIAKAAENDGFIPISVLLTFKRLQAMGATTETIKEAVSSSEIVELKDDSLRKVQTSEFKEYLNDKDIAKRVLYMRGFDLESTLDDIKALLDKYCKPVKVTMRRNVDRVFKGSCFVEFGSVEDAEKVLALEIMDSDSAEDNRPKKPRVVSKIEIMRREDYLSKRKSNDDERRDDRFGKRVKTSFGKKLYKFEFEGEPVIKDIKEAVKECAFVDLPKRVLRMKYAEEWNEKAFDLGDKKIKLTRMSDEETEEYLKGITIKKITSGNK